MSNVDHPNCYGTLFPDLLDLPEDRPARGKVFTVLLRRAGGMHRCSRSVSADMEQWDRCQQCPDYQGCYEFSMAKVAVQSAIQDR